jgi:hypothetical protein
MNDQNKNETAGRTDEPGNYFLQVFENGRALIKAPVLAGWFELDQSQPLIDGIRQAHNFCHDLGHIGQHVLTVTFRPNHTVSPPSYWPACGTESRWIEVNRKPHTLGDAELSRIANAGQCWDAASLRNIQFLLDRLPAIYRPVKAPPLWNRMANLIPSTRPGEKRDKKEASPCSKLTIQ